MRRPDFWFHLVLRKLHAPSEMATVPETRVPDGFYPIKRRVWNKFSTSGYVIGQNLIPIEYGGYGCACILPIPAYPRVKNTCRKNKPPSSFLSMQLMNLAQIQLNSSSIYIAMMPLYEC
jgi:hypothetical protein